MRAPLSWLREHAALPETLTPEQISDKFVELGFEIDGVDVPAPTVGPLLVGRVLTIEELTEFKKPIRFCTVDLGQGNGPDGSNDPRGIICGASNFAVDDLVVVAPPGTVLPGGFEIASRQTYGRLSDGMICSVAELGTGTDHDGILVLGSGQVAGLNPGDDARPLIGADDPVFDISVETDRGYAMSIRGLAREIATGFGVAFADPAGTPLRVAGAEAYPVRIDTADGCTRYVATRVSGIDPTAPSPLIIRNRLAQAGIRSISLTVDVTNYVMLECGQPLHAFDASTLRGPIVVRRAADGEKIRTLDSVDRTLTTKDIFITDDSGPIGLAGVMGGENTEITSGTTNVLIEAAAFDAPSISHTSRRLRLPSEAAKRFERGVDPQVGPWAAERAVALIAQYSAGVVADGRTDVGTPPAPVSVILPLTEPERLVGRPYDHDVIADRLRQIGCTVEQSADSVAVTPPSWRPDLTRPADLVEEIARLESYETIPAILPVAPAGRGYTERQQRLRSVAADLVSAGLTEVLSFPFVGAADLDALDFPADDVRRRQVRLANPLDAARPFLRTTLLPGLLDTVVRNISRGVRDVQVFEIGQVFLPRFGAPIIPDLPVDTRPTDLDIKVIDAGLPDQPRRVAIVLAGEAERSGWWGVGRAADWSDIIEWGRRIVADTGHAVQVVRSEQSPWHPGRCAELRVGGWPIGQAGELHPAVVERVGLPARTVALELNLDSIPERPPVEAPAVSAFPPVHVDVALVVDGQTRAADVAAALVDGGGELLDAIRLFDVYTGDQVVAGRKSLAFALTVRAADRTLTAAEANGVRDAAVAAAAERCGAELRT